MMRGLKRHGSVLSALVLVVCAAGGVHAQGNNPTPAPRAVQTRVEPRPLGQPPAWAPDIDREMQAVIEQMDSMRVPPLQLLTPHQARNAPSATDAVRALVHKAERPLSMPALRVAHMTVPGLDSGTVFIRSYTPTTGAGPFPVIVYYHGGGWVIANLNTYEPSAMGLADQAGAIVLSVAYRQGPEHRFPAAHDDALAAYQWAVRNAQSINGDPRRIALAGESAGGNLAVATAMSARQRGLPAPVHILSVYPIADGDTASASYDRYANAKPLSRPLMAWFFRNYLRTPADARDPRISLVRANVQGMAPTTLINAQIDPLLSDGEELAARLRAAGVDVQQRTFPGVTHEFFGMADVLDEARQAQAFAVQRLRAAFGGR